MLKRKEILLFLFLIVFQVNFNNGFSYCSLQSENRRETNFNKDWKFHIGDLAGSENPLFSDAVWQDISLPHTWQVISNVDKIPEHVFEKIGWYRKHFTVNQVFKEGRIFIEFEMIRMGSRVWINGYDLGEYIYGDLTRVYDITDYLDFEKENILAVRAGDGYAGGGDWRNYRGIIGDVKLISTDNLHFAPFGIHITPVISESSASIEVKTKVKNSSSKAKKCELITSVVDFKSGNKVILEIRNSVTIPAGKDYEFIQKAGLAPYPELWSPENPYLYTVQSKIHVENEGVVTDKVENKVGFRWFEFTPDRGFFLNGRPYKLKGTNRQSEFWGIGDAWPNNLIEWELKGLKDMGCNIIRTSHYIMDREVYKVCDEIGLLVFNEFCLRSLRDLALRDLPAAKAMARDIWGDVIEQLYNHPSIIIWSYFNEAISQVPPEMAEAVVQIAKNVNDYIHSLDPTRKTAIATFPLDDYGFFKVADICAPTGGANCDVAHSKYPEIVYMWSEYCTMTRRGQYGCTESYCEQNGWTFHLGKVKYMMEREWFCGGISWCEADYIRIDMPEFTKHRGLRDLAYIPKDIYYMYQSVWTEKPMLHLCEHWNWPGEEGKMKDVYVFSNADWLELHLNGKPIGSRQNRQELQPFHWNVTYSPGILEIKGEKNGKPVSETRRTPGLPARLKLSADPEILPADGESVSYILVELLDNNGEIISAPVKTDDNVTFTISGNGRFVGGENGDCIPTAEARQMCLRAGKNVILVKSGDVPGPIIISATYKGVKSGVTEINSTIGGVSDW